mmetsp:Transcript_97332/g.303564  ORF Transcript_97332/g.303564 Transcript_97332/m.303564 type:complete len:214 (+) Transcript_97332:494-1135(+)
MFWPVSSVQPLPVHQCRTSSASSVFPTPPAPRIKMTPDLCSWHSSAFINLNREGQLLQFMMAICSSLRFRARPLRMPTKRKHCVGSCFPLRSRVPPSENSMTRPEMFLVSESTSTPFTGALPMSLAARFTTSPRTVYSRRCEVPTTPHQQVPVATPARPSTPSSWSVSQRRMAVSTARMGSSEKWFTGGSPNTARSTMPLSLMSNLFMLPSNA